MKSKPVSEILQSWNGNTSVPCSTGEFYHDSFTANFLLRLKLHPNNFLHRRNPHSLHVSTEKKAFILHFPSSVYMVKFSLGNQVWSWHFGLSCKREVLSLRERSTQLWQSWLGIALVCEGFFHPPTFLYLSPFSVELSSRKSLVFQNSGSNGARRWMLCF